VVYKNKIEAENDKVPPRLQLFVSGVEVLPNMAWLGDAAYLWPILCGQAIQVSTSPSFFHAVKVW
jgi:hypothetical protein